MGFENWGKIFDFGVSCVPCNWGKIFSFGGKKNPVLVFFLAILPDICPVRHLNRQSRFPHRISRLLNLVRNFAFFFGKMHFSIYI